VVCTEFDNTLFNLMMWCTLILKSKFLLNDHVRTVAFHSFSSRRW